MLSQLRKSVTSISWSCIKPLSTWQQFFFLESAVSIKRECCLWRRRRSDPASPDLPTLGCFYPRFRIVAGFQIACELHSCMKVVGVFFCSSSPLALGRQLRIVVLSANNVWLSHVILSHDFSEGLQDAVWALEKFLLVRKRAWH